MHNAASTQTNAGHKEGKQRTVRRKRSHILEANDPSLERTLKVTRNPFENTPALTCYEVVKRIVVGLTFFPIRCIIFVLTVLILWSLAFLTTIGFPLVADRGCYMHKQPLPTWRRIMATPIVFLFRIFLWCMGFWNISIVDHRKDTSVDPKIVVIGPHVTMFDMFVMMYVYPRSGFLGQHHTVKIPILSSIGTVTQGMFIDIADKESKHSCKEGISARASPDWKGGKLLIFPEGTITNGKQFVQFKAGAFTPGEPVQPVVLRYPWSNYDISWVGKNRDVWWGFRCALQVINHCEVDILEAYIPSNEEKSNAILYANNVRQVMARWDELPTTEHTYDDVFFYREAVQAGVGNDFLVKDIKKMFQAGTDELKTMLDLFRTADQDGSGYLSCQEVMEAMQLKPTKHNEARFRRIFNFFDTDHSGVIDYREFVQIMALLSGRSSGKDLAMLAFVIADDQLTGVVDKLLLMRVVDKLFKNASSRDPERQGGSFDPDIGPIATGASGPLNSRSIGGQLFADFDGMEVTFSDYCDLVGRNEELLKAAVEITRSSSLPFKPDLYQLKDDIQDVVDSKELSARGKQSENDDLEGGVSI